MKWITGIATVSALFVAFLILIAVARALNDPDNTSRMKKTVYLEEENVKAAADCIANVPLELAREEAAKHLSKCVRRCCNNR